MSTYDDVIRVDELSYKEAALMIGCTHHYVRMLANKGTIEIVTREEVRPNVLKVFVSRSSVEAYMERRRRRVSYRYRLTSVEKTEVDKLLRRLRNNVSNR